MFENNFSGNFYVFWCSARLLLIPINNSGMNFLDGTVVTVVTSSYQVTAVTSSYQVTAVTSSYQETAVTSSYQQLPAVTSSYQQLPAVTR